MIDLDTLSFDTKYYIVTRKYSPYSAPLTKIDENGVEWKTVASTLFTNVIQEYTYVGKKVVTYLGDYDGFIGDEDEFFIRDENGHFDAIMNNYENIFLTREEAEVYLKTL